MNEKQLRIWRVGVSIVLAIVVGFSMTQGSILLPAVALITAAILMYLLKRRVTDVLVDERIEKIAGQSALKTFRIGAALMALASMILVAGKNMMPEYAQAGYTLAYATCGLLLLYSISYRNLYRKPE